MSRYEVKVKSHAVFGPLFWYVHDSQDWATTTLAKGTTAYSTEAAAQEVADRLNAEPGVQRFGRNGLTRNDVAAHDDAMEA